MELFAVNYATLALWGLILLGVSVGVVIATIRVIFRYGSTPGKPLKGKAWWFATENGANGCLQLQDGKLHFIDHHEATPSWSYDCSSIEILSSGSIFSPYNLVIQGGDKVHKLQVSRSRRHPRLWAHALKLQSMVCAKECVATLRSRGAK